MSHLKNQEAFINELISTFPEIKSEVLDEDYLGLVSLQIGCFRRFTQDAIVNNNLPLVKKCFDFIDKSIDAATQDIKNSIAISYLSKLDIKKGKIETLLSFKLKNILNELNEYYESLAKDEQLNKFLHDLKND
jgi:hypothetical protein